MIKGTIKRPVHIASYKPFLVVKNYAFAKAWNPTLLFIICCIFSQSQAQEIEKEPLLKVDAIAQMLENNYGIKVAKNNEIIAENNAGILNSGYLPSIFGLAETSFNRNDSRTDFGGALGNDGNPRPDNIINNAETTRYNASINVEYTLFDGLGRLYAFKQFQEQYDLSQLEARATIEANMIQLLSVYYEVARLQENIKNLEQALEISKSRVSRAQYQFDYGQVNRLAILNAEVDIVTDSTNLLNEKQNLRNAQRDLNVVMASDISDLKRADTAIFFTNKLLLDNYSNDGLKNNVRILQADKNIAISNYDIRINKSLFLPSIGLTGSYGWNRSNNPPTAFFPGTVNTQNGLAAAASLRWNLFDGGRATTLLRNSKVVVENQDLAKKQLLLEVSRDIANAKGNYENAITIYELQVQNVATNQANFERTEERLKLGQITTIEFRQAQLNLLNAQTIRNAAKYTAKLAEVTLLQLTGQLLNVSF